jgi:nucleoid DNA-binding protein
MEYNEEIYRQIAKERNTDKDVIKEVCTSMFEFVNTTIEKGKYEAVRLPYFGIWRVKPERINKLKEQGKL